MHQLVRGKARISSSSIKLLETPPAVERFEHFNDSKLNTAGACQGGFPEVSGNIASKAQTSVLLLIYLQGTNSSIYIGRYV